MPKFLQHFQNFPKKEKLLNLTAALKLYYYLLLLDLFLKFALSGASYEPSLTLNLFFEF